MTNPKTELHTDLTIPYRFVETIKKGNQLMAYTLAENGTHTLKKNSKNHDSIKCEKL